MKADVIVRGKIYTGNDGNPLAEAIAVRDGIFLYVGASDFIEELQDDHTKVYELEGELVIPGMFEGHAHVCSGVELFRGVNLYGLTTPDCYIAAIKTYIEEHPKQKFILGRGFQNGDFGSLGPTAQMLDLIATDKYIIMDSEDCHSSWVNSKVLSAAGIDQHTSEVSNGVIIRYEDSGYPTGWLKEKAMDLVTELIPGYLIKDYKEGILIYQEMALSYGIVCCFEPILNDKKDMELRMRAYHELDLENQLIMQFRASITIDPEEDMDQILEKVLYYRKNYSGSHFMLMGVKVFIDGVIEGHTAFLRQPYADSVEDYGNHMWKQERVNDLFVKAARLDIPIHVHAIGDAAIDSALEGFEQAAKHVGKKELRNCITHLQLVAKDQYERFQELGIIAVTNPFWHYKNPGYYHSLEVPYLGEERADGEYPLKSFFDHKITVTQASDWPVSYCCYPLIGLETAVTRREAGNTRMEPLNEEEGVEVEQMLKAVTLNGAYQMAFEHVGGSIEVGKRADFLILDQDILTISQDKIAKTAVCKCFIDGKEVYQRSYNTANMTGC